MRSKSVFPVLAAAFSVLLPLSATPALSQQKAIGLATHIENQVSGIISGQQRTLTPGSDVYQYEIIKTNQNSKTQLAFLDSTVLSIGPMSEVNLDSFVYNPDRNAGDVVVNMGRGTFRFITGSQEKRNYKIVTPVATIGVRGTVFHVKCDDNGCQVVLQEGGVTLQLADGTTTDIDQPGWGIAITPTGFVGVPMQWPGGAGDPFGAGWQQFADAGAPQTTGATGPAFSSPLFSAFFSPSSNVVPPCLTPSCN